MRSRHSIYIDILQIGILNSRRAAAEGDVRQAFIEADHIHNLPDLLRNMHDEEGHRHYWNVMRPGYISISKSKSSKRFEPLWRELETAEPCGDEGKAQL